MSTFGLLQKSFHKLNQTCPHSWNLSRFHPTFYLLPSLAKSYLQPGNNRKRKYTNIISPHFFSQTSFPTTYKWNTLLQLTVSNHKLTPDIKKPQDLTPKIMTTIPTNN